MTHINQRKEPTLEPSAEIKLTQTDPNENTAVTPTKMPFSLHTNVSPGYTFTPVMKRPQGQTTLSTAQQEEQAMLNEQNNQTETTAKTAGGFSFTPVSENESAEHITPAQPATAETVSQTQADTTTFERIIPAAPVKPTQQMSYFAKYRRLLIVLLLLLILLLVFFLLKPQQPADVEQLQQDSSLPIEFRPVDEEEAKRAEASAQALQQAQQTQENQAIAQQNTVDVAHQTHENSISEPQLTSPATPQEKLNSEPLVATSPQKIAPPEKIEVVVKPVQPKPIQKPATTGSVIYQPETPSKPEPSVQVAYNKPSNKEVVKKEAQKPTTTPAEKTKAAPVVKAQPATPTPVVISGSMKVLTVPKGVSLMQVFRDHQLNISDVNAMSKVNNVVSHLKAGERVTVRLDKNNRVTEMAIGSGGKFIRQENGTYLYK